MMLLFCLASRSTRACAVVAVLTAAIFSASARETKFLAHGWDCQSAHPDDVLASAAEFDKTPLDGISLSVRFARSDGVVCSYKTMISDPAWRWEDIKGYVPTLREIVKHKSLRESLLSAFRCPKTRLDWRDDAAWANFAGNMRVLARLAREGNVKGLMIDPEDYPRSKQFYWQAGDLPYDNTAALARKRGREIFSEVFKEKPDAVILAFWLLSTDKIVYNSLDPKTAMREAGCLFPAFIDGLMDVMPASAVLVDGNEATYRSEAPYRDHFADACQQRRNALDLLSPENRDKYRVQHRVGSGVYLDGYWVDPSDKWHFPPFNGTRADRLGLNVAAAAEAADYVWLDGEWRTYIKWKKAEGAGHHIGDNFMKRESWDEIMPGFWNEILAAKDPLNCKFGRSKTVHSEKPCQVRETHAFVVKNARYGEIYEVAGNTSTPGAFLRVDWKRSGGTKWASRANSVFVANGRTVFRVPQGVDSFAVVYNALRCKGGAEFSEVNVGRLEVLSYEERTLTVAADELHKYWLAITGDQKIVPVRLAIDAKVSNSGNDAYTIKTVDGVAHIAGSNARSVLYGVYDLLERRGGCGWFWDGDVVPKRAKIDVSGLDVHEESKFEYRGIRYFAHRGLVRFQAEHWGFEEWKREIDWCLKKRLNTFMLRIGQDDIFQKAFPQVCSYPDASKPLPGQHSIYNNRSLFWPLEYRGELRREVMDYAFARGMSAPEDFGTMTHWYSRTPQDFLEKMKPEFLPQAKGSSYGEKSGLVWDIRKKKWMDAYWKLTDASIREYGRPDILHTIGVAERKMSEDPKENRRRKIDWTNMLLEGAAQRYPGSLRLLAGWDLYCMNDPEEVRSFLSNIPDDVLLWDYEADAYDRTNFTEWDVVGKRPYTFGVFMAYEAGLDTRTQYARLAERQKLIENDPMCRGYILWPESSHVDSIGLEWFAKNAWRADRAAVEPVVADYCARRYPAEAEVVRGLWEKTIDVSTNNITAAWQKNAFLTVMREIGEGLLVPEKRRDWHKPVDDAVFAALPEVFAALKSLDWEKDAMLRRDMTDIARTWADRLAVEAQNRMFDAYFKWLDGDDAQARKVVREANVAIARMNVLADILALHEDFSICDTLDGLNRVHPVPNPDFLSVLIDNAANYYCASHQAELARHCYIPAFEAYVAAMKRNIVAGDRTIPDSAIVADYRKRVMGMSYGALKLAVPRTRQSFESALENMARSVHDDAVEVVGRDRLELKDKAGDGWWRRRHEAKLREIKASDGAYDFVMIGDSITDFWETKPGNGWENVTNAYHTLNLGFRGDRVQNVIWRLTNGELDGYKAKNIVIMIGTNNHRWTLEESEPSWTVSGIRRIAEVVRSKQPDARIILQAIPPRGCGPEEKSYLECTRRNREANVMLKELAEMEGLAYLDFNKQLEDPVTGFARRDLFPDSTHPSSAGYAIWLDNLNRVLSKQHTK